MCRWLDMLATLQSVPPIAMDSCVHAAAGLVDFLTQMKHAHGHHSTQ